MATESKPAKKTTTCSLCKNPMTVMEVAGIVSGSTVEIAGCMTCDRPKCGDEASPTAEGCGKPYGPLFTPGHHRCEHCGRAH